MWSNFYLPIYSRGRSLQSRDRSRTPRPIEFRSTLDYYTRQLKLEDSFTNRRPEEARFLDVSGGPKIDFYVDNVENNRKDFRYTIHKDVQEQDYVLWSVIDQKLQYMNRTVWQQEFSYSDYEGQQWSISQTFAFNMTDKAYLTLVIRDKEGKVHEREYQVYVEDEEWSNAVEYKSDWMHFWAGKWEGEAPIGWIWLPEFGIEIEQKLQVDEEGRGDWHQEIRQ